VGSWIKLQLKNLYSYFYWDSTHSI